MDFPLRLLPATAMLPHFLLRRGSEILQPGVLPVTASPEFAVAFGHLVKEMESQQVVAAVSFGARSSLEPDLFAVFLFVLCRYSTGFLPADFVTAAGPFGFAGVGSAGAIRGG